MLDRKRTLVLTALFLAVGTCGLADSDSADIYPKVSDSLAIVRGSRGAGSGFVAKADGATWLYTNEHVLRSGSPVRAYFIDGKPIRIQGEIEVAENRDVARAKLAEGTPALKIASEAPPLEQPVFVFGNSDGAGVVTKLTGRVVGVGNDRIEVNAKFVQGNSGSAILNESCEVLGIATEASLASDPTDWVKAGTRFNAVRRYGERLEGIVWKRIDWETYDRARRVLGAFDDFRQFMIPLCFRSTQLKTDYDLDDFKGTKAVAALGGSLTAIDKQDRKFRKAYADMESVMEKRKKTSPGSMSYPKKENVNIRYRKLKREQEASVAARLAAFRKAVAALKAYDWPCARMRRDAEELQKGFRHCVEIYAEAPQDSLADFDWSDK